MKTAILYCQYGKWTVTMPFDTRAQAERHADLYFRQPDKDYVVGITFLELDLPDSPKDKELGDYRHPELAPKDEG